MSGVDDIEMIKKYICENINSLSLTDSLSVFQILRTRGENSAFKYYMNGECSVDLNKLDDKLVGDIYISIKDRISRYSKDNNGRQV